MGLNVSYDVSSKKIYKESGYHNYDAVAFIKELGAVCVADGVSQTGGEIAVKVSQTIMELYKNFYTDYLNGNYDISDEKKFENSLIKFIEAGIKKIKINEFGLGKQGTTFVANLPFIYIDRNGSRKMRVFTINLGDSPAYVRSNQKGEFRCITVEDSYVYDTICKAVISKYPQLEQQALQKALMNNSKIKKVGKNKLSVTFTLGEKKYKLNNIDFDESNEQMIRCCVRYEKLTGIDFIGTIHVSHFDIEEGQSVEYVLASDGLYTPLSIDGKAIRPNKDTVLSDSIKYDNKTQAFFTIGLSPLPPQTS